MSWQPIETAPRDGSEVLLFDGFGVSTGEWMPTFKYWNAGYDNYGDPLDVSPTHWMPLPAPPEDAK